MNIKLSRRTVFGESPIASIYVLQCSLFFYILWRLLSRDYSFYGLLDDSYFIYSRPVLNNTLFPISWITSFIFLTRWIIEVEILEILQLAGIAFSFFGVFGIFPRFSARILFFILLFFTSLVQATNAEIEGSTLIFAGLFVLGVSKKNALYSLTRKKREGEEHYSFLHFLLLLLVCTFYFVSGVNKIVDYGILWPIDLKLTVLSENCQISSIFTSSRYSNHNICLLLDNRIFDLLSSFMTIVVEIGFISCVFYRGITLFYIVGILTLHFLVLVSSGINFMGNGLILVSLIQFSSFFDIKSLFKKTQCKREYKQQLE